MSDYVPDCLLTKILSGLPLEDLLRFRFVSKHWYSLISSPDFLSNSLSTAPLYLFRHISIKTKPKKQQQHYSIYRLDPPTEETEKPVVVLVREVKFPFNTTTGNHFRVVGFCNGLFCLSDDLFGYTDTVILWNPTIRKSLYLPKPCHVTTSAPHMFFLGFGFDLKTNDFKVVRIAYLDMAAPTEVEVYSLSTGLWKTVNSKGINGKLLEYFYTSTCINGAIHWISYRETKNGEFTNSLLVFDLSDETFSEMGLPDETLHVSPSDLSVTLCGDRISVFQYIERRNGYLEHCVVFVMNQYGDTKSWRNKFYVIFKFETGYDVVSIRSSEDTWDPLRNFGGVLFYESKSKEFDIHGEKDSFYLSNYIESFVLLDRSSVAIADPSADSSNSREPTGLQP